MEIINTILVFLFLLIGAVFISGLAKPRQQAFIKQWGPAVSRKTITKNFLPLIAILFLLIGVTTPQRPHHEQPEAATQTASQKPEPKVEEKTITETHPVDFVIETHNDANLQLGQTKVVREGTKGVKTLTYKATFIDDLETQRELTSEVVTTLPINKIVANGTYAAPTTSNNGYTNSQGDYVPSPSSSPSGATARCNDGTYSYSQSRRGTCSHHGGVAEWL